ncbi:MAG TPA: non-canonical purine NTP pyrophosphatase [Planctomycetota bacterium]|nr:non-canonical purine NTP pyrophosphatase [Planctomycetota bacterium]
MTRVLLATTNRGKQAELRAAFDELGWEAVGLEVFPGLAVADEPADTLAANARAKALHYARLTGLAALADDSGLEVEALGGAPGVRSARYAGPAADDAANRERLLAALAGRTAPAERRARFVCALCLVQDGRPLVEVAGRCEGTIAPAARGGFGYDPLFVPDDPRAGGRTFGELPPALKQALSHRGAALAALRSALAARTGPGPRR